MPYRLREHIEHPIGFLSAVVSSVSLSNYMDLAVNAVISLCIGGMMVVVTHFTKRWLQSKFPIDK